MNRLLIVTIYKFIYRFTFYQVEREPVDELLDGDNRAGECRMPNSEARDYSFDTED